MTETAASMIVLVGTQQLIRFEDVSVFCNILDSKSGWGNLRICVSPVNGTGSQWVDASRISTVRQ